MKVEIFDGIYLIASGRYHYGHPTDCNVYAVRGKDRTVLIDVGSGFDPDFILRSLDAHNLPPETVDAVYATHSHWDHVRGATEFCRRTSATLMIHSLGTEVVTQGPWSEFGKDPHPLITFEPCPHVSTVSDGDEVDLGGRVLRAIHTPGHTPDSVCYAVDVEGTTVVFTGDVVTPLGRPGIVTRRTDFEAYLVGLDRLISLRPQAMLPGHGVWTLSNAIEPIEYLRHRMDGKWTNFGHYPPPFDSGNWVTSRHPEWLT